ncbi:MAG: S1/P1 nuclease [Muribaculaceae bacterium]
MTIRNLLLIPLIALMPLSAFSWGQKGHDTTAVIAERHLTPATQAAVTDLLDGKSLVYYANWPDNACHTPEYAYTKTWHYKNIDAGQSYADAPDIPEGNIVVALEEQCRVLADSASTRRQKWLALVLTVHFMGDLHQPMHMGRLSDRGGNNHKITFFGAPANLHSVWDTDLPEAAHKWSYTEWADNIDRATEAQTEEILSGGTPDRWGEETYGIVEKVYHSTPEGTDVSYDYIAEWTPVVEDRFLRGGLRLADLLNGIFDPGYVRLNRIDTDNEGEQ